MFKKIKYLLRNFDTLKKLIEEHDKLAVKVEKKRVSIAGVPEEQRKYIEDNFKIN